MDVERHIQTKRRTRMKLLYVKCLDMAGADFWATASEVNQLSLGVVEIVGWLWSEKDEIVKVVSTIGHKQFDDAEDHYAHIHAIPKGLIVEMRDLDSKKTGEPK